MLRRILLPSYSDWLFAALIVWLFVAGSGWTALLADGDTGWHIRTGEMILDTGHIPREDPFSFSKRGAPWYAWEWLSDVIFAAAHRSMGLKGVVLISGVTITTCLLLVFRHALWCGADVFSATVFCLLAGGASSIHFLARPHIFSLLLLAISFSIIDRDRVASRWRIWLLVPLTAVWANLHGGFVALPVSLGLLAAGDVAERRFARTRRYATLAGLCAAASLLNPYGFELHRHIFQYVRSDWIRTAVEEFQSPKFRSESAFDFEVLLFGALALAAWLARERRYGEALVLAAWAHAALASARHVPLFVLVVAPVVAAATSGVWRGWARRQSSKSAASVLERMAGEFSAAARRTSVTPVLTVVALAVLPLSWPRDFPELKFPVALVARHPELAGARVFTSDQWGDYLLYRFHPRQQVFIDGRSDFYGEGLGRLYLRVAYGHPDWSGALERHGVEYVLARREWPLASMLRQTAGWELIEESGTAVLFRRNPCAVVSMRG